MTTRTRIAPSPTGFAHVGTGYQALFDYVWAKKHGGQFVLRLEDTDRARLVEGADKQIFEMLQWLGLPYDEGPDRDGDFGPYVQSERLPIYRKYADQLLEQKNAYYCFCTAERLATMRAEQQQHKQAPKYDRHCLGLSTEEVEAKLAEGAAYTIRLKVPEGKTTFVDRILGEITIDNAEVDDQVLLKSDGFPTYHLAVVVDDHLMAISDIIRGPEWIPSTPKHVLLYGFFGWELPTFSHIPLLLNADKSKLSKRKNDVSLASYKEKGYLPEALVNFLSQLGWSHPEGKEIYSLDEMIALFDWERVPKTGSIFNWDKLDWFNGQYIRAMEVEELAARIEPYSRHSLAEIKRLLPLVHDRLVTLAEFDELVEFLFSELDYDKASLITKGQTAEATRMVLVDIMEGLSKLSQPWTHEAWEELIREVATKHGWKAGQAFMSLRVAITFSTMSPPLFEAMELLGAPESLERIGAAIGRLN